MNIITLIRRNTSYAYTREFKAQIKLFIPFLLGLLCSCAMSTVDTLMAGLAGTIDISGVAVGCAFYWPAYMFLAGLAYGVTATTSHLYARREIEKMKKSFFNALVICIIFGVIVAALLAVSPEIYNFIPSDKAMIEVATNYIYFVAFSLPFTVVYNVYRSYSEGLGITKPTLIFGILQLVLNIPLNYIFIFGEFGMPRMGGIGCGATSCFINILCAVLMVLYVRKSKKYPRLDNNKNVNVLDKSISKAYLHLSVPIGITRTLEVTCFSLAAVILSPLGPIIVAAHSITLNVSSLIFMIPLCISITATIRTASNMGSKNWIKAFISLKVSSAINLVLYLVYFMVLLFLRDDIARLYTKDTSVLAITNGLMLLNCFYLFPDSWQNLFCGVLQGFKDTKIILINTIVAYWIIGIPLGLCLAYGYLGLPKVEAYGIWIAFCAALTYSSITYLLRVRYLFKHKKYPKLLAQSYTH